MGTLQGGGDEGDADVTAWEKCVCSRHHTAPPICAPPPKRGERWAGDRKKEGTPRGCEFRRAPYRAHVARASTAPPQTRLDEPLSTSASERTESVSTPALPPHIQRNDVLSASSPAVAHLPASVPLRIAAFPRTCWHPSRARNEVNPPPTPTPCETPSFIEPRLPPLRSVRCRPPIQTSQCTTT